ncbi:thioredoxin-dependent thiol peroxidase [Candidatus Woesearchaeota archaeon]|nr:thioredoxin-dependent thiol peroxidase [Candidatus Woesearchaeota archaeon]
MTKLKFASTAPEFILPNQESKNINLNQFRGRWVVLYFYPKDNTPGCTQEAQEFSQRKKEFEKLNATILAVSKDDPETHCLFIKNKQLDITLLSDADHKVMDKYGVWGAKKFMGREFLGIHRTTFLIDQNGLIAHIWENVKVNGHVEDVLLRLKELSKEK